MSTWALILFRINESKNLKFSVFFFMVSVLENFSEQKKTSSAFLSVNVSRNPFTAATNKRNQQQMHQPKAMSLWNNGYMFPSLPKSNLLFQVAANWWFYDHFGQIISQRGINLAELHCSSWMAHEYFLLQMFFTIIESGRKYRYVKVDILLSNETNVGVADPSQGHLNTFISFLSEQHSHRIYATIK